MVLAEHELCSLDALTRQAADLIERTEPETALRESERLRGSLPLSSLAMTMPVTPFDLLPSGRPNLMPHNTASATSFGQRGMASGVFPATGRDSAPEVQPLAGSLRGRNPPACEADRDLLRQSLYFVS